MTMPQTQPQPPVVFLGPSAAGEDVRAILPGAEIVPPIARDQLYRARERGRSIFLIIDGTFAHALAVSPREVVDVLRDGALVYGASSMGALRAADCAPAGMRGVGVIFRLYQAGHLDSDDEVAVATNPERSFAATSVALINVRYAVSRARKRKLLDRRAAASIIDAAREMFFAERSWPEILRRSGVADGDGRLQSFCRSIDLKRDDALRGARAVASSLRGDPDLWTQYARMGPASFRRPERYTGHDPLLGLDRETLLEELMRWLIGSGRYQKYIWPLAVGEPELDRVREVDSAADRAVALRDALAALLARICSDTGAFTARLAAELDLLEEMDAETMRWHSVRTLADAARRTDLAAASAIVAKARGEIAVMHGVRDWPMLVDEVRDGRLFGAIPVEWIDEACSDLALARTFKATLERHGTGGDFGT